MTTRKTATKKTAVKKTGRKKVSPKKPALKNVAAQQKKSPEKIKTETRGKLLAAEPAPYRIENRDGKAAGLVICDHASARVPRKLKDMGLKKTFLKKHIGWDIGAEEAALHISDVFDMPAVIAQYSRLVVDLNRAPDYCECMPEESDNIKIPANAGLSKKDREARLNEIYWPYHKAVARQIDRQLAARKPPFLLFVHSFTPHMDGELRPWHISVLWKKEEKIAKRVVHALRAAHPGLLIGENDPYALSGVRFAGSSVWRHAEERNLPYVLVEFRQDLVDTKERAVEWAEIFIDAVRPVICDPETFAGRKIKSGRK